VDKSGMIKAEIGNTKYVSNGHSAWDTLCNTTLL
jgi:hypothetical protein